MTRASIKLRKNISKKMDDRGKPGHDASICDGPGSAKQHCTLHRARDTRQRAAPDRCRVPVRHATAASAAPADVLDFCIEPAVLDLKDICRRRLLIGGHLFLRRISCAGRHGWRCLVVAG
jgi:hypothetical protein